MTDQEKLLRKATYGSLTAGYSQGELNAEQSAAFIRAIFDSDPTTQIIHTVTMKARTQEFNKISVGTRLAIAPGPKVDPKNYIRKPSTAKITLTAKKVVLPWQLTLDELEDSIEGGNLEDTTMNLMATQFGLDLSDLFWNGDATLEPDSEASGYVEGNELLYVFDGWLRQLNTGSNLVNFANAALDATLFKKAFQALPAKYRRGNRINELRWFMPSYQFVELLALLGDTYKDALAFIGGNTDKFRPFGIPIVQIPCLPDSVMVLADPKNLTAGIHRQIRINRAAQGKDELLDEIIFFMGSLRADCGVEWKDGAVKVTSIKTT